MDDITCHLYPEARHEVLNEINRAEVYEDVWAWLQEKMGERDMIIIACTDDNQGMLFNHRRQSMDRVQRQRMLQRTRWGKVVGGYVHSRNVFRQKAGNS